MAMNIWKKYWDLRTQECPCDVHFVEWLETARLNGIRIYHFGTGGHHHVGVECARPHLNNTVFGVTASPKEYKSYVDLVTRQPEVSKTYLAYFGDIYTSNSDLLPAFDVVTLFHLCEFRDESNSRYGAKTDAEVLDLFARHTARDGHLLFYKRRRTGRPSRSSSNGRRMPISSKSATSRPCGFSARPRNSPFPRPAHAAARHALPDPDVSPGPHAAATARPAAQPERRARCVPPPDDAVQAARLPRPERARTAAVPAGRAQRKVFGITFDDGFLNVLTHAMPVLDALGFTATCYFVAGRFGGENDWDAAADTARSPLMTHADMLAWRDHGHEIGSHTLDHVALSHVPAHVSEVQIVESKQRLEALSGQTVESFCYPYGDLDPRVRGRRRGLPQRDDDPARLRRYARRSVPVAADHGRGRRRCDAAVVRAKARVQRCR